MVCRKLLEKMRVLGGCWARALVYEAGGDVWDSFVFCRGDEAGESGEALGIKGGGEDLSLFGFRNELGRWGRTKLGEGNQRNGVTKMGERGWSSGRKNTSNHRGGGGRLVCTDLLLGGVDWVHFFETPL